MLFDGSRADVQDLCYLVVRMTRRYELSDLSFPRREDRDRGIGTAHLHAPQITKRTYSVVSSARLGSPPSS